MSSVQDPTSRCPAKQNPARPGLMFGIGLLLCALCCSLPLLAGIGIGGAALAGFGGHLESIGLGFLAVGAGGFVWGLIRRRRAGATADSCAVGCDCQ
jgi:hypothetical protein